MTYREMCSSCGRPWVVNKKFMLCNECNYKRLHNGKTAQQMRRERDSARGVQPRKKWEPKPIKARSTKGERVQRAINATYAKMDASQPMICMCCGDPRVTHSHILPRSQYGMFAADARNIVYHCVTCHDIWEHGPLEAVEQLHDFDRILAIIQELAPYYFFRRFGVILEDYLIERKKTINNL